jgi:UDP-N-acetylmuramoyl-tripeptide--D-alanyl-D-alanine ligase
MDGHSFINQAEEKGAVAAVVARKKLRQLPPLKIPLIVVNNTLTSLQQFAAWHRRRFDIPLLGITGTNGKTTTKEMIAWILQTKFNVHKTVGNLNNHIGTPLTLLQINSDHQISVVEMGTNKPGEIALLTSLVNPTAALITNIGRGHLEFFSSLKGVAQEKLSLFRMMHRGGTAFLNQDDKMIRRARIRRNISVNYSLQTRTTRGVQGELLHLDKQGCGIWRLNNKTQIHMQIPGVHNVQNALAASSVSLHFGMTENEIKSALENYSAYDKRMQIIRNGQTTIINDTYNANPDSFIPALQTLSHLTSNSRQRKIVVIGDMLELGNKSQALHRELFQQFITSGIAAVFSIGPVCKATTDLFRKKGVTSIFSFSSHEELAGELKNYIRPGDTILLKGSRGMQMERVLAFL